MEQQKNQQQPVKKKHRKTPAAVTMVMLPLVRYVKRAVGTETIINAFSMIFQSDARTDIIMSTADDN